MSVLIKILHEQDAEGKEYGEPLLYDPRLIEEVANVVGHALVLVAKKPNGDLDVERIIGINSDSAEDNAVAGDFIKTVEKKLAELFEPTPEPSKLWVPN